MDKTTSQAIFIATRLQRYRDTVYKLFTVSGGEAEYRERMKMLQLIIKSYKAKGLSDLPAIQAAVENEDDARLQLQFFAAGYELLCGHDFTDFKSVSAK